MGFIRWGTGWRHRGPESRPNSMVAASAMVAAPAAVTGSSRMPARPPVLRALGLIPFHMSLIMGIIIVAIRVGVIGIVII
jgi:hypothetical protein